MLQASPVKGLQLDPYGIISVNAHQEALAQQQIAARLTTPGLRLQDRAYTLYLAVLGFTNADVPERLPVAEKYLEQLDALGTPAAHWQKAARLSMVNAYYLLGRSADVARVGTRAFALMSQIPYEWRGGMMYMALEAFGYAAVMEALSGQPNGRATIQSMNAQLMKDAIAPPAFLEQDSTMWTYVQQCATSNMQGLAAQYGRVGQPGTPLVANYWINRTSRDSQTVAVNDGKIRVIELGSMGCTPCRAALPGLERLYHRYPGVEFVFLTWGGDMWGNRVVDVKENAGRMADHFINNMHLTFPIGIAMPTKKVATEDGGEVSGATTPMWNKDQYIQTGKPTFYILDGKGMIRRVVNGYSRDLEEKIAGIIEFLRKDSDLNS
jgi:thiol-disulfide isomerase/thioredoxin